MKNIVYIATSLDGFIAKENGDLGWLMEAPNPDNSDFGFNDFMESIDAIVMGKNTFEMVSSFGEWPYIKPVFVLSNSLEKVPENFKEKMEVISGDPESIVKELNSRKFNNLYIDGGITVQNFLKYDLIDEFIITRIPIILGKGIPLFGELEKEQKFEHIETEIFNNTLVKSKYRRIGRQV